MDAVPLSIPDAMASMVFFPSSPVCGRVSPMDGSCAALVCSDSKPMRMPGAMMEPTSAPLSSSAVNVIAVFISITSAGSCFFAAASTATHTKSLPTTRGLSMRMLSPVLTPDDTLTTSQRHKISTASRSTPLSAGTTEQIIAPEILPASHLRRRRTLSIPQAYCSAVCRVSDAI